MTARVFCQSSVSMWQLKTGSVNLTVTSPPYHVGKDYDTDDSFEDYLELMDLVFLETLRVTADGGLLVVNVANLGRRPYIPLSTLYMRMLMDQCWRPCGKVIWIKAAGSNSCAWGSWMSASNPVIRDLHEYCLIFSRGEPDQPDDVLPVEGTFRLAPASATRVGHPAPFPVGLPAKFIDMFAQEGDLILDPFAGAGSTLVAANQVQLDSVGYELEPEYATLAARRANAEYYEQTALF